MRNILTIFVMTALLATFAVTVFAQPVLANVDYFADLEAVGVQFTDTGQDENDLPATIGAIIQVILGFLGVVVVILIIYAGFLWMTAGGNSDQVKKAKDLMINAVIGLAIILSAYAITAFVLTKLLAATGLDTQ